MELKAIGLIEVNSIARGIKCADEMIKASEIELIYARSVCPGRFLTMIGGDVSSVKNSIEIGRKEAGEFIVDSFLIPNVHPAIFSAIGGTTKIKYINALGVIETYSVASCIIAADKAAKSAEIDLIEIRCASGLAGKSFVTMTGDVSSVNAAVNAGVDIIAKEGMLQSYVVIPSLSRELFSSLI